MATDKASPLGLQAHLAELLYNPIQSMLVGELVYVL